MKKIITLVIMFFVAQFSFSQKMMTRSGEIKFEASMPAFEEVAAKNTTASAILDQSNGKIAVLALIKAFKFKAPLMEEHFNENYMESSKFPKATFKGKIVNFDISKLSAQKTDFDLEGELTMHGVTKKVKTKIALILIAGKINALSNLVVKAKDFSIAIPSLVKSKIAEDIDISIKLVLEVK
jgi:polyisoprenoid-binding protein YceI